MHRRRAHAEPLRRVNRNSGWGAIARKEQARGMIQSCAHTSSLHCAISHVLYVCRFNFTFFTALQFKKLSMQRSATHIKRRLGFQDLGI
jgi:hypothetical protein